MTRMMKVNRRFLVHYWVSGPGMMEIVAPDADTAEEMFLTLADKAEASEFKFTPNDVEIEMIVDTGSIA